jgi:hypothetical protein
MSSSAGDPSRSRAHLVGIGSPQGGHLGRSSGAASRRVLTSGGGSLLVSDLLSHLVEKVVCRWLNCPDNSASKCVGEAPAYEHFCRGPQPVKGANLVGIGSPQGGHLGRWSGAARRQVLTLRNFCGRQVLTTGTPTTIQCLPIRIGGFQDQACLALFVWSSGPSGLWCLWSPLKGDLGQPLFLPRFFLLILESPVSADFGRCSDHPAGFCMAASAYSNMRLGDLAGGSCLSLLWRAAGSVRVQLLCPIFIRSRGSIR